jgi:cardiolipin synthase
MTLANAGFLLLGLLFSVLALMGLLNAVRGTPVKRVIPFDADALPLIGSPEFRASMELVTRTSLCAGHHAELFWNGDQTYPRLWDDLRGARKSITLQLYYCTPGRMADILREILIERARAGVQVLFLYDAFGTTLKKEYFEALHAAGVRTAKFRPMTVSALNTVQHRAHVRGICVDGTIGWTGGFGIDDKWFGDGRTDGHWRDSNVRFTGPAVDQLQAAFTACWGESTGDLLIPEVRPSAEHDGAPVAGSIVAGLLYGSPSVGSTEAERFVAYSLCAARSTLYITNSYFVPDRDLRRMLIGAARRGVDTRVLTVSDTTDIKSTWYAGRARYEELLRGGVRIYEYTPVMMHAKTLCVDGQWSAVGSMNADNRSLSLNEETVLLMLDPGAGRTLEQHFMDDIEHAEEITLESFRRRSVFDRVKERVCYAFWRVL